MCVAWRVGERNYDVNITFMTARSRLVHYMTVPELKTDENRKLVLDKMREYKPSAIFLSCLDTSVRRLAERITDLVNELKSEPNFKQPIIQLAEDDTARWYVNSENIMQELKDVKPKPGPTGRYCFGLGRRQLRPEVEYASLPKEDLMAMSWHPSQSLVSYYVLRAVLFWLDIS